jgi:hypothetical protein
MKAAVKIYENLHIGITGLETTYETLPTRCVKNRSRGGLTSFQPRRVVHNVQHETFYSHCKSHNICTDACEQLDPTSSQRIHKIEEAVSVVYLPGSISKANSSKSRTGFTVPMWNVKKTIVFLLFSFLFFLLLF